MQHPEGQVLSIDASADPAHAVVEVAAAFRCERCASGKGCGAGLLAGDAAPRRVEALIARQLDLHVGDRVRLELAGDNVLRAAGLVYGLPLGGALAGAGLAWWSGAGDAAAALAATVGALSGIATGRRRLRRAACLEQFRPIVTARLGTG
jgi:sigma-E factor negative regulatory protein RseC